MDSDKVKNFLKEGSEISGGAIELIGGPVGQFPEMDWGFDRTINERSH